MTKVEGQNEGQGLQAPSVSQPARTSMAVVFRPAVMGLAVCNRSYVCALAHVCDPLGASLASVKRHGRMRSCRRDRSQGNWAIDGPVGVLRDYGAGSIGLTTASLCPAQCSIVPNSACCPGAYSCVQWHIRSKLDDRLDRRDRLRYFLIKASRTPIRNS